MLDFNSLIYPISPTAWSTLNSLPDSPSDLQYGTRVKLSSEEKETKVNPLDWNQLYDVYCAFYDIRLDTTFGDKNFHFWDWMFYQFDFDVRYPNTSDIGLQNEESYKDDWALFYPSGHGDDFNLIVQRVSYDWCPTGERYGIAPGGSKKRSVKHYEGTVIQDTSEWSIGADLSVDVPETPIALSASGSYKKTHSETFTSYKEEVYEETLTSGYVNYPMMPAATYVVYLSRISEVLGNYYGFRYNDYIPLAELTVLRPPQEVQFFLGEKVSGESIFSSNEDKSK